MKLLEEYFKKQTEVHDYFGYTENWVAIPLDDCTDEDWCLLQNSDGSGQVIFGVKADVIEWHTGDQSQIIKQSRNLQCYSHSIYTQRFLSKWVYRGADYTMICCDTQVDGNKFLCVFDNAKEFSKELIEAES